MKRTRQNEFKPKVRRQVLLVKFKSSGSYGLRITFPYHPRDVHSMSKLEGRRYIADGKYWVADLTKDNIKKLKKWNFDVDKRASKYLRKFKIIKIDGSKVEIEGLQIDLYPYQKDGVAFVEAKNGRALIADEMGLGKTAQALAWLQMHTEHRPAIIVCPASLKYNWEREAFMWMRNPNIQILSGKTPYPLDGEIFVINYDILHYWIDVLLRLEPKVIVADEGHFAKNNSAKRTKALKRLAKRTDHFIALTGTPIINKPIEFYNIIQMIDPTLFTYWQYARRYCDAKHNGFGWDFNGSSNELELNHKLRSTIMIRRLKKNVMKDLPEKIRTFIPCELTNKKQYQRAEDDFIQFVRNTRGKEAAQRASQAETLTRIEGLKQVAVDGKMTNVVQWVQDFFEVEQKLVIFSIHKFAIDKLMEIFGDIAVKVDGSVTGRKRQDAVDKFQNDSATRLFVGNIKAAGVGLTLTESFNALILELPWTPGELAQAEDRLHRIGQKEQVNINYMLARGTIEEEIAALLDEKRKVLDGVLDGKVTKKDELLLELILNKYR
jgi:SWI/SNF-related matrix-associated actin-dependent regulator 1 of chromatin subfamily A